MSLQWKSFCLPQFVAFSGNYDEAEYSAEVLNDSEGSGFSRLPYHPSYAVLLGDGRTDRQTDIHSYAVELEGVKTSRVRDREG